ncbi:hypothetical protein, partial [Sphaerisporangium fuscum]|uniref:hypothetical protein n=1 Tax=Sphaerisporangium fuscum TaxID=2835868 RepID=UPI001BDCFA94
MFDQAEKPVSRPTTTAAVPPSGFIRSTPATPEDQEPLYQLETATEERQRRTRKLLVALGIIALLGIGVGTAYIPRTN